MKLQVDARRKQPLLRSGSRPPSPNEFANLSDSIKFIPARIDLELHPSTPGGRARALSDLHLPVHTPFRPLSLILRFFKQIHRSKSVTDSLLLSRS